MGNGEWRMENWTALPFSLLLSSIIEYAQSATPIIGEAFPIPHSPFSILLFSFFVFAPPNNSPIFAVAIGGIAQLARALAWHARGHRFESDYLHFNNPERFDFQRVRDFFLRFMPHLCHILRVFDSRVRKIFVPNAGRNRMSLDSFSSE